MTGFLCLFRPHRWAHVDRNLWQCYRCKALARISPAWLAKPTPEHNAFNEQYERERTPPTVDNQTPAEQHASARRQFNQPGV